MSNEGFVYYSKSAEDTILLGKKIGALVQPNDVIALTGDLGAGKTTFVKGIAEGLGIQDYVTSPTFVIINIHKGTLVLNHIDLYRLEDKNEIEDLGIEEYFKSGGVCLIEWAERMGDLLPKYSERIGIEVVSDHERKICVSSGLAQRLA
ncbi:MAG: tRNA (adenosine(37)-N6)-threonylcarbamoyltransferase complex ATPase subunit type 1 TsaE [Candidatus Margulisiibacteriota bacterium]